MQTLTNVRTSRVGRKPILIPQAVEVKLTDQGVAVKGPKGQYAIPIHPFVEIELAGNALKLQAKNLGTQKITGKSIKLAKSIVGTMRANINNAINGVVTGCEAKLVLFGVGYRAQVKGKVLGLSLGFSHPTEFAIPDGIIIETPTQTEIIVKGIDKELVGLVAAQIRSIRPPEPYKGKGVRYAWEVIVLKETKKK